MLLAATVIAALAVPAYAVKPQPPVTVACQTVENKAFVYTAECSVEAHGDHIPANVRISSMQDKGTLIAKYKAENPNGIGKWTIVFEAREQKPLPVYFDALYKDGTTIRVTGLYDPYGVLTKKQSSAPAGIVKGTKNGDNVKEYPSN